MMTVFVAAVALALSGEGMEARVSYVTPGATLAKVAQDLSDQTGVKILPGPGMEREIVVMRIDRQPLSEVLPRLANVVQGKIVEVSDTLRIDFDIRPFEARQEAARQETRAYLPELRRLINEQTDEEPEPAYLVLRQFIAGVTDDQIIDAARREVSFSSDPYPGQHRAPRIDPRLIRKWLDQETPVEEPEEPIDPSSARGQFRAAFEAIYGKDPKQEPMPEPHKVVFEIDEVADFLSIFVLDERLRTLVSESFIIANPDGSSEEKIVDDTDESVWPSESLTFTESEDAKLSRLVTQGSALRTAGLDQARVQAILPRPADYEPFGLVRGQYIVEMAKADNLNLIGSESAVRFEGNLGVFVASGAEYRKRLSQRSFESRRSPWWTLKPRSPRNAAWSSFDRAETQRILLAHDLLNPPTLNQLAAAFSRIGNQWDIFLSRRMWLRLGSVAFQRDLSFGEAPIELLANLNSDQRDHLLNGGTLRIGSIPLPAQLTIESFSLFKSLDRLGGAFKWPTSSEQLRQDEYSSPERFVPTSFQELRRSGTFAQGTIESISRVVPGVLMPAGDHAMLPMSIGAYEIALRTIEISQDDPSKLAWYESRIAQGRPCDIREYRVRITVAPGYGFEFTLIEVLNIRESTGELPQELREAIARERELLSANPLLWPDEDGERIPPPPTFSLGIR